MKISNTVRYADRDILVVTFDNGDFQPFYRSSGRNSGMQGTFLPFDGIWGNWWFAKHRFAVKDPYTGERLALHRFGTQELKDVSDELGKMNIQEGREVTAEEVNNFLSDLTNSIFPC